MPWPRCCARTSSCVIGSGSPDATRICHSTRSMPVIDLGDRVLDLQAGVHLEEEEVAVLVDELDGAGVVVADGLGRLDGRRAHRVLDAVGQAGRRCLLDQLLVTPLRRAVAGRHPHDVAVRVADDLHLDVARPRQVALDVDLVAPEEVLGLALRARHQLVDLVGRRDDLHPPPAAAERGLDGDRPAVLLAERADLVGRLGELGRAGDDRGAAAHRRLAARHLVAHLLDGRGRRTDERHAHVRDRPREVGVLAEEAVPGVHAVGAALADRRRGSPRC